MHTVSEIAITRCMMPPSLVGDLCAPATTVEQDAIKGNWVRVDRDLNKQAGLWTLVRTYHYFMLHISRLQIHFRTSTTGGRAVLIYLSLLAYVCFLPMKFPNLCRIPG